MFIVVICRNRYMRVMIGMSGVYILFDDRVELNLKMERILKMEHKCGRR